MRWPDFFERKELWRVRTPDSNFDSFLTGVTMAFVGSVQLEI